MDEIAFDVKRGAVEIWHINYPAERVSREIGYEGHSDNRDRLNNIAGPHLTTCFGTKTLALAHLSDNKCLKTPVKWRSTFFCKKIVRQSAIIRVAIDLIKESAADHLIRCVERFGSVAKETKIGGREKTCAPRTLF